MVSFPDDVWVRIFAGILSLDLFTHVRFVCPHFNYIITKLMHVILMGRSDIPSRSLLEWKLDAIPYVLAQTRDIDVLRKVVSVIRGPLPLATEATTSSLMHALPRLAVFCAPAIWVICYWHKTHGCIPDASFDAYMTEYLSTSMDISTRYVDLAIQRKLYDPITRLFMTLIEESGPSPAAGRMYVKMLCATDSQSLDLYAPYLAHVVPSIKNTLSIISLLPLIVENHRNIVVGMVQQLRVVYISGRMPPCLSPAALPDIVMLVRAGISVPGIIFKHILSPQVIARTQFHKLKEYMTVLCRAPTDLAGFRRIVRHLASRTFFQELYKLVAAMPKMVPLEDAHMTDMLKEIVQHNQGFVVRGSLSLLDIKRTASAVQLVFQRYRDVGDLEWDNAVRQFMMSTPFDCLPLGFVHTQFGADFWHFYAETYPSNDMNMLYLRWLLENDHPVTPDTLTGEGSPVVQTMYGCMLDLAKHEKPDPLDHLTGN